ncbi:MAG TPA: Fe-S cluster assembly protein SufD [Candidatus Polarisedimenticolia bacterium]|nr:Fe-S cluster assembly protein SufD [Candidatus Polarisedimenticolia bacterium]
MMAATPAAAERYLDRFERMASGATAAPWLAGVRRKAIERFAEMGFPTTRQEEWRYTSVAPIASGSFEHPLPQPAGADAGAHAAAVDAAPFGGWGETRLVFVDGLFAPALSRAGRQAQGVTVAPLAAGASERTAGMLAGVAGWTDRPFTALNTALFQDGAVVAVPAGRAVEEPIQIVFHSSGRPVAAHPRCLIVLGKGAQATVVECYSGEEGGVRFVNAVTEIVLEEGASARHYRIQREPLSSCHVGTVEARLGRSATLAGMAVSLGGRLSRVDIVAVLAGEGAACTLDGLYVLKGDQHCDHHTVIDHAAPHGTSRELYKGVLAGRSRGVFDGTVIVRKDAQKTDSRQENRNLLLSSEALVDTKPTLQILADDVRCTHAATIGRMDEQSLFYLRSRGLDPAAARLVLISAFVSDVAGRIGVRPLREGLGALLAEELGGGS